MIIIDQFNIRYFGTKIDAVWYNDIMYIMFLCRNRSYSILIKQFPVKEIPPQIGSHNFWSNMTLRNTQVISDHVWCTKVITQVNIDPQTYDTNPFAI